MHALPLMRCRAGAGWLLAAAGCCWLPLLAAAHKQQPAAAIHVKFFPSRVTFFMTNNFSPNPVFA
jgi:hypothetical protein